LAKAWVGSRSCDWGDAGARINRPPPSIGGRMVDLVDGQDALRRPREASAGHGADIRH